MILRHPEQNHTIHNKQSPASEDAGFLHVKILPPFPNTGSQEPTNENSGGNHCKTDTPFFEHRFRGFGGGGLPLAATACAATPSSGSAQTRSSGIPRPGHRRFRHLGVPAHALTPAVRTRPCLAVMKTQPENHGADCPRYRSGQSASPGKLKRRPPAARSPGRGTVPGNHRRNPNDKTNARPGLRPAVRQPVGCGEHHTAHRTEREPGRLTPPLCCGRETADTGTRQPSSQKRWHRPCQRSMSRAMLTHAEDLQIGTTTPTNKERCVVPI